MSFPKPPSDALIFRHWMPLTAGKFIHVALHVMICMSTYQFCNPWCCHPRMFSTSDRTCLVIWMCAVNSEMTAWLQQRHHVLPFKLWSWLRALQLGLQGYWLLRSFLVSQCWIFPTLSWRICHPSSRPVLTWRYMVRSLTINMWSTCGKSYERAVHYNEV